jgi:hypothetical protein
MKKGLIIAGVVYVGIGAYFALQRYNNYSRAHALNPGVQSPKVQNYALDILAWPIRFAVLGWKD